MRIPVSSPSLNNDDFKSVMGALESGWISGSRGDCISKFESEFSEFCGAKYGVACSNGTTALHLATALLGLKAGEEVIVPDFTNIATILAVIYTGATPVLVDSDPEIWGLDADLLISKITPRTKAILPVHIYGHPVEMGKVMRLASEHKLVVIEDAAEAHGAECDGRRAGGIGDIGCFSFYANKIITTGEGGMLITNNEEYAKKARSLANLAYSDVERYQHDSLGFNYRMSNILAALGCSQLNRIDDLVSFKRSVAMKYNSLLSSVDGLRKPVEKSWAKNVYWMYGVVLDDSFGMTRDDLRSFLAERGVETRAFFYPMHQQPVFKRMGMFADESYPVSEVLARSGLYLPCGLSITDDEIRYVADCVKQAHELGVKREDHQRRSGSSGQ
jgi:perosamine synthetase